MQVLFSTSMLLLNATSEGVKAAPLFTNDAVVLGLLVLSLTAVLLMSESSHPILKKIFTYVPALLLCYFVPALLNWPLGWVSGESSQLYTVATRYLLPASLIFLCLSIDFKGIMNLGPKAVIMFLTATLGIIIGGPIALFVSLKVLPMEASQASELWKGLSTIAGSWIGGGANQTAMKEVFEVSDQLFASMVVVDIIVANIWMGFLLYGAGQTKKIDAWLKADTSSIDALKQKVEGYSASIQKIPSTMDLFILAAIGIGGTGLSHILADIITPLMQEHAEVLKEMSLNSLTSSFFWLVVVSTSLGLGLSFSRLRSYEGVGASKMGSVFIYILVATIGMKMNIREVFDHLDLFFIGIVWMIVHVALLLFVAKLIKAPFFFVAVGSQANVGGAASAPVVAAAFSSSLAPVGVLLAVLGYALGTYGAIICAQLMSAISN